MKAICIGHSTYDITLPIEGFPKENQKQRIKNIIECGGGSASNGAYLLSKWKVDTTFYSVVGNDYYGKKILQELKKIKLNRKYIEKRRNYQTSCSYILVNTKNSSRTVITSKKEQKDTVNKKIKSDADVLLMDGEHYLTAIDLINKNQQAIKILDASRVNKNTKKLGKMVDFVICSKPFAEEFANKKIEADNINTLIYCYDKLKEYFKNNIIITLDDIGSFTKLEEYKIIPSIKVNSIDSTGAGDIFHGAFAYFIMKYNDIEKAIKLSSIAAALSTTKIGSRYSIPELNEVLNYDQSI